MYAVIFPNWYTSPFKKKRRSFTVEVLCVYCVCCAKQSIEMGCCKGHHLLTAFQMDATINNVLLDERPKCFQTVSINLSWVLGEQLGSSQLGAVVISLSGAMVFRAAHL